MLDAVEQPIRLSKQVFVNLNLTLVTKIKKIYTFVHIFFILAPRVGLEPTTTRLTAECSTD